MPPDSSRQSECRVHHQIAMYFEANVATRTAASVFGGDAVHHAGGAEARTTSPGHFCTPAAISAERTCTWRIDEAAVSATRADAVASPSVTIPAWHLLSPRFL